MPASLREYTSPLLVEPNGVERLTDLFLKRESEAPSHVAFQVPGGTDAAGSTMWRDVTTKEFFDSARALARHFIAAGIKPGDAISIMGPTRYEWVLSDVAALWAGAIVVPIYDTSAPSQVEAIVEDAGVMRAIAGTAQQAEALAGALGSADRVWTMEEVNGYECLRDLAATEPKTIVNDAELESARTSRALEDVATIVYTSGTTSDPKGVQLTHGNFVAQLQNIGVSHGEILNERGSTILFLPLSHVLARGVQLICLALGMRVAHLSDTSRVIPTFTEIRPTFVMVVPRVLEKILNAVAAQAEKKRLGGVWHDARETAVRIGTIGEGFHESERPKLPFGLAAKRALYERLFYRRIRTLLGGNIQYILCGGAKLHPSLALAFRGFGIPIIEGYGLTETTAPIAANRPGDLTAGSVGVPVPGTTIRISDEGELLAKGPGVSPGYRNPEHTAAAYSDGFLRTGDLGSLDSRGHLTLKGRSKDVIVTSGGKTIEPAGWEGAVEQHPSVAYAVAVGDDRPYLTALLIQQSEEGDSSGNDIEIIENPKLIAEILPYLENANLDVSRTERIKKFALVKANLSDPNLVTPSLKLRRAAFLEKAKAAVEELYEKAPKPSIHELVKREGAVKDKLKKKRD
ncbi:AMP-dependent synthetase/ligase [Dermabacter sp. p3-SID358]|uniref:AMP-dependent synthetase/ligase n=1 Tax=Dermabacter sp. p3-SID358 TaxID=2916114 RepID=UPI0021A8834F|nr:AMP-dependent synthetase/ligase [Dermabacter sp. p3-SID358]MCT1866941.1 AMP-dependent synthetase/ligase [Dermabacter sp. p3-SID358]